MAEASTVRVDIVGTAIGWDWMSARFKESVAGKLARS